MILDMMQSFHSSLLILSSWIFCVFAKIFLVVLQNYVLWDAVAKTLFVA